MGYICTHTLWTMGFSKNRLSRDKVQSSVSNISSDHVGAGYLNAKLSNVNQSL